MPWTALRPGCYLARSSKIGGIWVSKASGIAKISGDAVRDAREGFDQAVERAAGEQLPLLGDDDMADLGESEAHIGLPDASEITAIQMELGCDVKAAVAEHRKRGRQPGAKGRRSNDFRRYMLQFGPHPGISMMRRIARPTEMLAAELGCSMLEAAHLQARCEAELMPYFEGKKPIDVNVNANGHMTLIIGGDQAVNGGMIEGHASEVPELSFPDQETAEKRGFSGGE